MIKPHNDIDENDLHKRGKPMNFLKYFLLFIFCFVPINGFACQFDTDCEVGSRCVKSSGNIYGICTGGLYPGNSNDRVPVEDPLDLDRSYGNTCSFDTDCGVSNKCYKEPGNITGVCVKGR